jgi:uncharacterized membrane protein HdeD (DUF308 family)
VSNSAPGWQRQAPPWGTRNLGVLALAFGVYALWRGIAADSGFGTVFGASALVAGLLMLIGYWYLLKHSDEPDEFWTDQVERWHRPTLLGLVIALGCCVTGAIWAHVSGGGYAAGAFLAGAVVSVGAILIKIAAY